jgi:hypothetical protein
MSNNNTIQFPTHKRKAAQRRKAKLQKMPTSIATQRKGGNNVQ